MDNEEHHHRRHCPHWASERRSTEAATATRNMSRFARDLARVQDCCVILFVSLFLSFSLSTLSIAASSIQQSQRKREREKSLREKDRDFSTQTPLPTWLFFKSNHHLEKILCLHSFYPARDGSFLLSSLGRSYRVRPISKCKLHLENFETVKVKRNQVRENKYEWELSVGN